MEIEISGKRFLRTIYNLLLSVFVFACMYFGVYEGVWWCANLFTFYTWLIFILIVIAFVSMTLSDTGAIEKAKLRKKDYHTGFNRYFNIVYRTMMVTALAAAGWYWYAIMQLIIAVIVHDLYYSKLKKDEAQNERVDNTT